MCDLSRTTARDFVQTRIIRSETQAQGFVRIVEDVANYRTILDEVKWHTLRLLPQLAAEINLLLRLTQTDAGEQFTCIGKILSRSPLQGKKQCGHGHESR